jgi:hypothetical protein
MVFPGEKIKSSDFWFVLKKFFVILLKVQVKKSQGENYGVLRSNWSSRDGSGEC